MSEHLSEQKVDRYRQRLMSPAELLDADDHLATCATCCQMLKDPQRLQNAFASVRSELGAVIKTKLEHPSYEQLAAYVDSELDDVDREIVKSHMDMCSSCAAETRDLLAFKAALAAETDRAFETSTAQPARHAPTRLRRFMASWQLPFNLSPLQAAGALAVASVFLGIVAAVWLRREMAAPAPTEVAQVNPTPSMTMPSPATSMPPALLDPATEQHNANQAKNQPAPDSQTATPRTRQKVVQSPPQNEVLSLNDGNSRIVLDRQGNVRGLESLPPAYQKAVREALTTQSAQTSSIGTELAGQAGTLMGGGSEGVSFPILSPVGIVVRTTRPLFRWGSIEGATSYSVKVYDSNLRKVAESPQLSGTQWSPAQSLERGSLYLWQVTAMKDGAEIISPVAPAPEAKFMVLEQDRADELTEAERKYAASHLTLGILYARSGLLEDAEREFQALVKANPDSPVARKLLRDVRAARQQGR